MKEEKKNMEAPQGTTHTHTKHIEKENVAGDVNCIQSAVFTGITFKRS